MLNEWYDGDVFTIFAQSTLISCNSSSQDECRGSLHHPHSVEREFLNLIVKLCQVMLFFQSACAIQVSFSRMLADRSTKGYGLPSSVPPPQALVVIWTHTHTHTRLLSNYIKKKNYSPAILNCKKNARISQSKLKIFTVLQNESKKGTFSPFSLEILHPVADEIAQ